MSSPTNSDASSAPASPMGLPHIRSSTRLNVQQHHTSTSNKKNPLTTGGKTKPKKDALRDDEGAFKNKKSWILAGLFVAAIIGLILFFRSIPEVDEADKLLLKFPRSLSDVRTLSSVLRKYRDENTSIVVVGFCVIYIFLQAFAIPGALFLSILAGPLFGTFYGLLLVSIVATTGSSICYAISSLLGRNLIEYCFPSLLHRFRTSIARHRSNLFFYLLFLRVSPILPNWFISISSPILDIPYHIFAGATLVGLIPANYIHVTTGIKLEELGEGMSDGQSPVNIKTLAFLFGLAFVALIPTLLKKKFEEYDGDASATAEMVESESEETTKKVVESEGRKLRSSNKKKVG